MRMILVPDSVIPEKPKSVVVSREEPFDPNKFFASGGTFEHGGLRISKAMRPAQSLHEFSPECTDFIRCAEQDHSFVRCGPYFSRKWGENRFRLKDSDLFHTGPIAYFDGQIAVSLLSEAGCATLWW